MGNLLGASNTAPAADPVCDAAIHCELMKELASPEEKGRLHDKELSRRRMRARRQRRVLIEQRRRRLAESEDGKKMSPMDWKRQLVAEYWEERGFGPDTPVVMARQQKRMGRKRLLRPSRRSLMKKRRQMRR